MLRQAAGVVVRSTDRLWRRLSRNSNLFGSWRDAITRHHRSKSIPELRATIAFRSNARQPAHA